MPDLGTDLLAGMGLGKDVSRCADGLPAGETVPKTRAQAAVSIRGARGNGGTPLGSRD